MKSWRTSPPAPRAAARAFRNAGVAGIAIIAAAAAAAQTPAPPALPAPSGPDASAPARTGQAGAADTGTGGRRPDQAPIAAGPRGAAAAIATQAGSPAAQTFEDWYRADPHLDLDQQQRAWDHPVAAPGQAHPGVKIIDVDTETGVATIRTRLFVQTVLTLEPACDTIQDEYLSDTRVWRLSKPDLQTVTLYPYEARADGTLHLTLGSGRRLSFYLRSELVDAPNLPDVSVKLRLTCRSPALAELRGTAGAAAAAASQNAARGDRADDAQAPVDYLRAVPLDIAKFSYDDFKILIARPEDAAIAPLRVAQDGRRMILDYGKDSVGLRLPTPYRLEDGVDHPANYSIAGSQGQLMVIQGVGDLTLRHGALTVCITDRRRLVSAPAQPPYGRSRPEGAAPLAERRD